MGCSCQVPGELIQQSGEAVSCKAGCCRFRLSRAGEQGEGGKRTVGADPG
jgi:hypothetical protein